MCKTVLTSGIHNPPKEFPWLLADGFLSQAQNN